jgi:hypothetical protein
MPDTFILAGKVYTGHASGEGQGVEREFLQNGKQNLQSQLHDMGIGGFSAA